MVELEKKLLGSETQKSAPEVIRRFEEMLNFLKPYLPKTRLYKHPKEKPYKIS
ncbi:hypothetical protein J4217_00165 [Candidatus Pacearchaeota archaeon]|nr:hypothetical protein [Candidatus Pacearchaeota archaeon]